MTVLTGFTEESAVITHYIGDIEFSPLKYNDHSVGISYYNDVTSVVVK